MSALRVAVAPGECDYEAGETVNASDLIVVSTFRSPVEAEIAKGVLDEAGIESMIRSDNAGGMYPAIAESELLVRAEDLERATGALRPGAGAADSS